jgi:hypothetical protein
VNLMLADNAFANGFSAALIVPAATSTLRQTQREAADELHVLARYYQTHKRQGGTLETLSARVDDQTREAARSFGRILVEQGVNGTTYFLGVKLAIMSAGGIGGMCAQVGITGNTMITPLQTQRWNPAKVLFNAMGVDPDWVAHVSDSTLAQFSYVSGLCADFCGYGEPVAPWGATPDRPFRLRFEPVTRQPLGWRNQHAHGRRGNRFRSRKPS